MKDNKNLLIDDELKDVSGGTKSPPILTDVPSLEETKSPPMLDNYAKSDITRPKINPIITDVNNSVKCIYCGGTMRSNIKGKMTGGVYTCTECGATYRPNTPNPWQPGKNTI